MVAALTPAPVTDIQDDASPLATIVPLEVQGSYTSQWYSGIIKDNSANKSEPHVRVIDKGAFIEFVLPRGTASYTEIHVKDAAGNLVWKKQSFSKSVIRWHKQSALGSELPQGEYAFHLTQGGCRAHGVAQIN